MMKLIFIAILIVASGVASHKLVKNDETTTTEAPITEATRTTTTERPETEGIRTSTVSTTTVETPEPTTTTTSPTTTITTERPIVECPSQGVVFVPHPSDCSKYFVCINGNPNEADCPAGELFDPDRLNCYPEEEVTNCPSIPTTTISPPPDCSSLPDLTFHPVRGQCAFYYVCFSNNAHLGQCPDGQLFDCPSLRCIAEADAQCATRNHWRYLFNSKNDC